jgi:hypothetical protein
VAAETMKTSKDVLVCKSLFYNWHVVPTSERIRDYERGQISAKSATQSPSPGWKTAFASKSSKLPTKAKNSSSRCNP